MALSDTAYSHLVTWLKIGLTMTALAILSTLFLLARSPSIERAIPYADVDIDQLVREPRISNPDFSGVTPDGAAVSITARTARPDPADPARFHAEELTGRIDDTDGGRLRLSAIAGLVDTSSGTATLAGDVLVETSTGYAIRTEELIARLDTTVTESTGPVDVMAPFGHMTAGRFRVSRDPADDGAHLVLFTDGVDLIYDPRD